MLTPILIALVVGYLLGSLPFGYLVARAKGVNIFEVGSKNPGATNVRRVLGHGPGNLVLFLDALKGAAATGGVLLVKMLAGENCPYDRSQIEWIMITGLIASILGHSFSCFTKFKGGKSVGIALAIFLVLIGTTRYISLGSMVAAASLPVTAIVMKQSTVLVSVSAVVALFVIIRHRANISRLLAGTESKIGQKKS